MRLSDIMGNANLTFYPIVAMIIFLIVFVAVGYWALSKRNKERFEQASLLPLEDAMTKKSDSSIADGVGQ